MTSLQGKVALVTGGNSGIGLASSLALKEAGAKVIVTGRDTATLAKAEQQLGDDCLAVAADVSQLSELDKLYATGSVWEPI